MMTVDHYIGALCDTCQGQMDRVRHWAMTLFRGAELGLFSALIGTLVLDRKVATQDLADAIRGPVPDELTELPWQGCERNLFESITAALRERGQSSKAIGEIVETIGSLVVESYERSQDSMDDPFPGFYVEPVTRV